MPKLIIDNISVTVPDGTSVLEAAHSAGIPVPHFCWHPALGKAGACRVCAVKLLDGPVKGIQMSCMLPAQDGMVVSTTDEEAVAMRRHVIEWLMINHPHDCPVCDEGGECTLQDLTIAGGHAIRRYDGIKRTHANQNLSPYISHEMNRCIQCYRCVRFYQEFAGGVDFGVMGSAGKVYFGRFSDGKLESPFSGNLVDICPTGVFTDKTARFRARYWDYDMAPSVCPGCSLGCNTLPVARYRELLKIKAWQNNSVNGHFICDHGRFSNSAVNDPKRPRTPRVDGREVSFDEALDDLIIRITELQEVYGPDCIAMVGSPRMTLEGNIQMAKLADLLGSKLCYFTSTAKQEQIVMAVSLLTGTNSASMSYVQQADIIAITGCNLIKDAPMMALAVRQAWRNGAKVFILPLPESDGKKLPFEFTLIDTLDEATFSDAKKPVIICGTNPKDLEYLKKAETSGLQAAIIFDSPNDFAIATLANEYRTPSLEEVLASGKIKGIICFEANIPDEILAKTPILALADWLPTDALNRTAIFLPTTPWVEMDGTFINNEGRAQRFRQVMKPGLPIKGLDPAKHPPRIHRRAPPGSDPRPASQLIADLISRISGEPATDPFSGGWNFLRNLDPEGEGIRILAP
jgi:NADH-quinone oxidoreductase subunit G